MNKDDEIKIKLNPQDAEALRQKILKQICNGVQSSFDEHPQLQSAVLYIAQYWNDNANDEVHGEIIYSVFEEPKLPDQLWNFWPRSPDAINLPGFDDGKSQRFRRHDKLFQIDNHWESMGSAVTAFACYCPEGGSQHNDGLSGFSCYARFRRSATGVSYEVVGTKHRPWLDGVKPDYEDG